MAAPTLLELRRDARLLASFPDWLAGASTEEGLFPIYRPGWDYLEEMAGAYASGRNVVELKERQILASWCLAAYVWWVARQSPLNHCALVSRGDFEAAELARKVRVVARSDGVELKGTDRLVTPCGSQILVFPATQHAGISFTLQLIVMDEFADHPYGRQALSAIAATLRPGGQVILCSTTHPGMGKAGAFWDAWSGDTDALRVFFGRYRKPGRDAAWYEAESRKPGMDGAVMAAYYPRTPEEAFSSGSGQLFGVEFSEIRNVRALAAQQPWDSCRWRVAGVDLGGNDPTAITALGVNSNIEGPVVGMVRPEFTMMTMHAYEMYYQRGEAAASMQAVDDYLRTLGGPSRISLVPVDAGAGTASAVGTLRALGYNAVAAVKGRRQAFALMGQMLLSGRLTIEPACTPLIHEILTTFHKERRDMTVGGQEMALLTPSEHHADAIDTVKDALMTVLFAMPAPASREPVEPSRSRVQQVIDERRRQRERRGEEFVARW